MPVYRYRAVDPAGREQSGEIEAVDATDATRKLSEQALLTTALDTERPAEPEPTPSADAFVLFNQGLAELSRLHLPLPQALRELAGRFRGHRFRQILERVEGRVREGKPLAEAFAPEEASLPPYYIALLRVGTATGNLPAVLTAVADDAARVLQLKGLVRRAMLYPMMVVLLASGLAATFLHFFVPIYLETYAALDVELPYLLANPFIMEALVWLPIGIMLALMVIVPSTLVLARHSTEVERLWRGMPFAGVLMRRVSAVRLLSALQALTAAGVPPIQAVPLAVRSAGSRLLESRIPALEAMLGEGRPLSDALGSIGIFSGSAVSYLKWGEASGRFSEVVDELLALAIDDSTSMGRWIEFVSEPLATVVAGAMLAALFLPLVTPYTQLLQSVIRTF